MKQFLIFSLCLASTSGCSIYGMTRPQSVPEVVQNRTQSDEHCTSSYADPVADTGIALVGMVLTTVGAANAATTSVPSTGDPTQDQQNLQKAGAQNWGLAIGAGLITAAYLGSAIYGYSSAGQCSDIKEQIRQERTAALRQEAIDKALRKEQSRRDAIAAQEAEQQNAVRVEHEAQVRRDEEAARAIQQMQTCNASFKQRKDSQNKLNYHNKIQQWVSNNCKDVPTYGTESYVASNGLVNSRKIQTGTQFVCPIGKNRPSKLDGTFISDADIKLRNFATINDNLDLWNEDDLISKTTCYEFDKEYSR